MNRILRLQLFTLVEKLKSRPCFLLWHLWHFELGLIRYSLIEIIQSFLYFAEHLLAWSDYYYELNVVLIGPRLKY